MASEWNFVSGLTLGRQMLLANMEARKKFTLAMVLPSLGCSHAPREKGIKDKESLSYLR